MAESKTTYQTSNFEVDTPAVPSFGRLRALNFLDAARNGLTLLALCSSITILGVSADALAVYDQTHVRAEFMLPLWPDDFDLRPTTTLVACSAIVILANIVSLVGSKVGIVSGLLFKKNLDQRGNRPLTHLADSRQLPRARRPLPPRAARVPDGRHRRRGPLVRDPGVDVARHDPQLVLPVGGRLHGGPASL